MKLVAGGGVLNLGQAWRFPGPRGAWLLSTRFNPGLSARVAPSRGSAEVEAGFKAMIDRASKPGEVIVTLDRDDRMECPAHQCPRVLKSGMGSGPSQRSFALALATVNRSGGPFQAMIQTQRVIAAGAIRSILKFARQPPSRSRLRLDEGSID